MRKLLALIAAFMCVLLTLPMATAQPAEDKYTQLARDLNTPGLAVVEFDANGITAEHYVGVDAHGHSVTAETPFVWGSVSKSFTAVTAITLAEQGKLDLNAPVTRYVPELVHTPVGNNGATVVDLIHHTEGLPNMFVAPTGVPESEKLTAMFEFIAESPELPPRGEYAYSNVGYVLLQLVMERATGQDYGALLAAQFRGVTQPLSDVETIDRNVSDGYVPFFAGHTTVHEPKHQLFIGAGYLSGTDRQLAHYGAWQVRQHQQHRAPSAFARVPVGDREYGAGLFVSE